MNGGATAVCYTRKMNDILEGLNDEQKEAITHISGALIIVAGAGTGKTTVMTRRFAWLVQEGLAAVDQILAVTFTEKAAMEMEERIDRLLPYGHVDVWMSTFHAFCERVLRAHGAEIGLSPDFRVATDVDAWLLMREHIQAFDLEYYKPLGNPTKFIRALISHFSRAKDEGYDPDAYARGIESETHASDDERRRVEELARAYRTYETLLHEENVLDFGGLILYTVRLFETRPHILRQYQDQFRFIMVDEFQDTNTAQYALIKLLAERSKNITVVGDDDQAIYRFRGASVENILQFERDFPGAKRVVLTKNYRSGQRILDVAHAFIQANNPRRLEASGDGALCKKLQCQVAITSTVRHLHSRRVEDEARSVAEEMIAIHANERDVSWSDMAILVRANGHAEPFLLALEAAGIPHTFVAMKGLYRKSIVIDAIALLRIIDMPHDSVSLYRWLCHPDLGLPVEDLSRISDEARHFGISLYDACEHAGDALSSEGRARVNALREFLTDMRLFARRRNALEVLAKALKTSGLYGFVLQQEETLQLDASAGLQQFYERVRRYVSLQKDVSLRAFVGALDQELRSGEEGDMAQDDQAGPDEVKVMTVHASKGLEFKHVFLVNLVDRRFPSGVRGESIPLPHALLRGTEEGDLHLEEERRLLYVGLTRAKERVYVTSAEEYGGVRAKKISRFIDELALGEREHTKSQERSLTEEGFKDRLVQMGAHIPVPETFSFTQLVAYGHCPLQYKCAHVLKIPVPGSGSLSFGKSMHGTLQAFFERSMERAEEAPFVSWDELQALYAEKWIDEWYETPQQRETYRAAGLEHLRAYYESWKIERPHPLFLERGFTVMIGDVVLRGRVDRIDQVEGGVEIIDYKTGKPKSLKGLSPQDKMQLMLYQLAARDIFGLEPVRLTFHYLTDNTRVSFLAKEKQLDALRDTIGAQIQNIRARLFDPTPGFHCQFCDFKDVCPYRL